MKVEINVVLPDGRRERGRVDPTAPLDDILKDIVEAYGMGDPNDYDMAIVPKSKRPTWQGFRLGSGDTVQIQPYREARGKAFTPE